MVKWTPSRPDPLTAGNEARACKTSPSGPIVTRSTWAFWLREWSDAIRSPVAALTSLVWEQLASQGRDHHSRHAVFSPSHWLAPVRIPWAGIRKANIASAALSLRDCNHGNWPTQGGPGKLVPARVVLRSTAPANVAGVSGGPAASRKCEPCREQLSQFP